MQTATKGNTTWTYTYNADGLRTGKTNGTTTYTYTWNENRQLSSMVYGTSSAWFYYDHEGKPLYMEYADGNDECSGIYRYILNLQGDVVGLYDLTRDCMAMTYTYDAWGRELSWSTLNSGYAGLIFNNPLTYRGYIYDRETGFYYLQSRYYDPTIGRFLNADDVLFLGAAGAKLFWNLFTYCENEPNNNIDPYGSMTASIAADYLIPMAIFTMFMAVLYANYAYGLALVGGYATKIIAPIVFKAFWWKPWLAAAIIVSAVLIVVAAVAIVFSKASKLSAKERATNCPSWLSSAMNAMPPHLNERAQDYAKRLLDNKYGAGKWNKGPGTEYNQIVKYLQRNLGMH